MIQQKATPFDVSPEFLQANRAWNLFMAEYGPRECGGNNTWPVFVERLSKIKNDELITEETKKLRIVDLLNEPGVVNLYQTFKRIRTDLLEAMRVYKRDHDAYWKKRPENAPPWALLFDDSLDGAPWNEPNTTAKKIILPYGEDNKRVRPS